MKKYFYLFLLLFISCTQKEDPNFILAEIYDFGGNSFFSSNYHKFPIIYSYLSLKKNQLDYYQISDANAQKFKYYHLNFDKKFIEKIKENIISLNQQSNHRLDSFQISKENRIYCGPASFTLIKDKNKEKFNAVFDSKEIFYRWQEDLNDNSFVLINKENVAFEIQKNMTFFQEFGYEHVTKKLHFEVKKAYKK